MLWHWGPPGTSPVVWWFACSLGNLKEANGRPTGSTPAPLFRFLFVSHSPPSLRGFEQTCGTAEASRVVQLHNDAKQSDNQAWYQTALFRT